MLRVCNISFITKGDAYTESTATREISANLGREFFGKIFCILSSSLKKGMTEAKKIFQKYLMLEYFHIFEKIKPVKMCFEDMMAQLKGAFGCERRLKAAQRHRQTRVATSRINQELAARLILTYK
jgi:hypothetical protein